MQPYDLVRQILRLLERIIVIPDNNFRAGFTDSGQLRPVFQEAFCRVQNCGAGSIIKRKRVLFRPEFPLKFCKNSPAAATPTVNTLIGIAYGKQFCSFRGQCQDHLHLRIITILKFVNDDPPGRPVSFFQQTRRVADQVVEVHFVLPEFFSGKKFAQFADVVFPLHRAVKRLAGPSCFQSFRKFPAIFDAQSVLLNQTLRHFYLTVGIQNGKIVGISQFFNGKKCLQQFHRDAVKCSEPRHVPVPGVGFGRPHPAFDLICGFVGKSEHDHLF